MILDTILVLVLVICFITDLRVQKIYNKVIFPALAATVLTHAVFYGFGGLKLSIMGLVTGFGILLIPYLRGGMSAGDVKLLALIGAIKGSVFVFYTFIFMGLIGGAMALVITVMHKETSRFFKTLSVYFFSLTNGTKYKPKFPTTALLQKYPYGLAITGGALICLIFKEVWII